MNTLIIEIKFIKDEEVSDLLNKLYDQVCRVRRSYKSIEDFSRDYTQIQKPNGKKGSSEDPVSAKLKQDSKTIFLDLKNENHRQVLNGNLDYFNLIILQVDGFLRSYKIRSVRLVQLYQWFNHLQVKGQAGQCLQELDERKLQASFDSFRNKVERSAGSNQDLYTDLIPLNKVVKPIYQKYNLQIPVVTSETVRYTHEVVQQYLKNPKEYFWILDDTNPRFSEIRRQFLKYCLQKHGFKESVYYWELSFVIGSFKFDTDDYQECGLYFNGTVSTIDKKLKYSLNALFSGKQNGVQEPKPGDMENGSNVDDDSFKPVEIQDAYKYRYEQI